MSIYNKSLILFYEKGYYYFFLAFCYTLLQAQTNGITYQAVIYKPNGDAIPGGVNNTNVPLALKNVCLQFAIVDNNNQSEYVENVTI